MNASRILGRTLRDAKQLMFFSILAAALGVTSAPRTSGASNRSQPAPEPTLPVEFCPEAVGAREGGSIHETLALAACRQRAFTPAPAGSASARGSTIQEMLRAAAGIPSSQPSVTQPHIPAVLLPKSLDPRAIKDEVERFSPQAGACLKAYGVGYEVLGVRIVVAGETGHVVSADALGSYSGSPVGRCVETVVRTMRFPRFRTPHQAVQLPFTSR